MIEQIQNKIRILVAENFDLIRIGLRSLFENHSTVSLVAETDRIEDLFHLAAQHKPHVILMDLQLGNDNYSQHMSRLLHICPQSKVLALSQHNSEHTNLQALRSGATGIIGKHQSCKLLLQAIYAVHTGQIWSDKHIPLLAQQIKFAPDQPVEMPSDATALQQPKLSKSERRIAYLACKGLSAKEISGQLLLTEKTIRNQLSVIYRKVGVKKQIGLCLKAPLHNYFQ